MNCFQIRDVKYVFHMLDVWGKSKPNQCGQKPFLADGSLVKWIHLVYINSELRPRKLRELPSILYIHFSFYIQLLYWVGTELGTERWTSSSHGNGKCGNEHLSLFFFLSIRDRMKIYPLQKVLRVKESLFLPILVLSWYFAAGIKDSPDSSHCTQLHPAPAHWMASHSKRSGQS